MPRSQGITPRVNRRWCSRVEIRVQIGKHRPASAERHKFNGPHDLWTSPVSNRISAGADSAALDDESHDLSRTEGPSEWVGIKCIFNAFPTTAQNRGLSSWIPCLKSKCNGANSDCRDSGARSYHAAQASAKGGAG